MSITRRNFFGAVAGAAVVAPLAAKALPEPHVARPWVIDAAVDYWLRHERSLNYEPVRTLPNAPLVRYVFAWRRDAENFTFGTCLPFTPLDAERMGVRELAEAIVREATRRLLGPERECYRLVSVTQQVELVTGWLEAYS